jgi:hypothetical protein
MKSPRQTERKPMVADKHERCSGRDYHSAKEREIRTVPEGRQNKSGKGKGK